MSSSSSSSNGKNSHKLTELLSKRIKYSPAVVVCGCLNTDKSDPNTASKCSAHTCSDGNNNTTNNNDKCKEKSSSTQDDSHINKLIQYLTKSLDNSNTTTNSISSINNSSNESLHVNKLQKQESVSISSLSSINSNSSCSIFNSSGLNFNKSQYKRKKKSVNVEANTDKEDETAILVSIVKGDEISNENEAKSASSLKNLDLESLNKLNLISNAANLDNDTLQHMKNLDINNEIKKNDEGDDESDKAGSSSSSSSKSKQSSLKSSSKNVFEMPKEDKTEPPEASSSAIGISGAGSDISLKLSLNDPASRKHLWNLLKEHSTQEELVEQFSSTLHDKISFWDLVQFKLKYSKSNQLRTTYEIIDDYTILYSNMSALLEQIVNQHTNGSSKKVILIYLFFFFVSSFSFLNRFDLRNCFLKKWFVLYIK